MQKLIRNIILNFVTFINCLPLRNKGLKRVDLDVIGFLRWITTNSRWLDLYKIYLVAWIAKDLEQLDSNVRDWVNWIDKDKWSLSAQNWLDPKNILLCIGIVFPKPQNLKGFWYHWKCSFMAWYFTIQI